MTTVSKPSLEHVQIRMLARVALVLSSLAAIPGIFATPLGPTISFQTVAEGNGLLYPLGVLGVMVVGWWLYWTYWREVVGDTNLVSTFTPSRENLYYSLKRPIISGTAERWANGQTFWMVLKSLSTLQDAA